MTLDRRYYHGGKLIIPLFSMSLLTTYQFLFLFYSVFSLQHWSLLISTNKLNFPLHCLQKWFISVRWNRWNHQYWFWLHFHISNREFLDIDMCDWWELLNGYLPSVIRRNIFLWCVFVICKTGPQFQLYNYAIKT